MSYLTVFNIFTETFNLPKITFNLSKNSAFNSSIIVSNQTFKWEILKRANSLKKSFKGNKIDKKEKEEESDIEYDDVYVVEERTVPTAEIDNQDDEDLNEETGINIIKEIKKINTKIPVIILISKKNEFLNKHYLEEGVDEYIIKDNHEEYIKKIKKYL